MKLKEIYRDIPGYKGYYQVSNLGNVKSLERQVKAKGGSTKINKERILKAGLDGRGYLSVSLSKDGKIKTSRVHKLVAMAFLNHKPDGYNIVVDHRNNVKTDNRLNNLQLISARENSSKDRKGSSKYTGVTWFKRYNKWKAQIIIDGKKKHLGYFYDEKEAGEAYQTALEAHLTT